MNKSRFIFFLVVLGVVIGIARTNSRRAMRTSDARPAPTASPRSASNLPIAPPTTGPSLIPTPVASVVSASPPVDFKKSAERVLPAVVALSVFDASGHLLRNGTGFFVSEDGKLLTSSSIVDGGANAIATAGDGHIYNVVGILAETSPADVAILKAQVKGKVPFVSPDKMASFEARGHLAAIGNPLSRENAITPAIIADRKSDANSEWLELTAPLPGTSLGGPVINEQGAVLGLVALQRGSGTALNVVRLANALDPVFARIDRKKKPAWSVASAHPPAPPVEGPLQKNKVPLAGEGQAAKTRLIFSPTPQYPGGARRSNSPLKGTGRYRVRFANDGSVQDVQVVQSTHNPALDSAAVEALRKWKATPGQQWTANVPITFQP